MAELTEIMAEIDKIAKGMNSARYEQDYPNGTHQPNDSAFHTWYREMNEMRDSEGTITFRLIIEELLFNAFDSLNDAELRQSLLCLASGVICWVQAIDARPEIGTKIFAARA